MSPPNVPTSARLRRLGTWLIALAVSGLVITPAPAQHLLPPSQDPVEQLRQALRVPVREPQREDKAEILYRRSNLEKHVKALDSLGDLRRALALQEWRDMDSSANIADVDRTIREAVANRLKEGLDRVLRQGDQTSKLAALVMIGEMGTSIRDVDSDQAYARRFGEELAQLIRNSDDLTIAAAAAWALGRINPDPAIAAQALDLPIGRFAKASVVERQAAAEGLIHMINQAAQLARGRTTTGVQLMRADLVHLAQAVIPVARRGLDDPDVEVRRRCLRAIQAGAVALADMVVDPRPAQDLPPEGRALTPDDRFQIESYRREVEEERKVLLPLAEVLGEQATAVARLLADPNPGVRELAARTLEDMANAQHRLDRRASSVPRGDMAPSGDASAAPKRNQTPPLALYQPDRDVKPAPKQDLRPRNLPEPSWLAVADGDDRPAMDDPLQANLQDALPLLAAGLNDPDPRVRLATIEALELYGRNVDPAAEALLKALRDPDKYVRWAAARTVGNAQLRQPQPAIQALIELLHDQDLSLRLAAAEALGDYGEQSADAVPMLAEILGRDDVSMRVRALQTLVEIGEQAQAAIPAMIQVLRHPDDRVRRVAAEALGTFGPAARSAVPALRQAMLDTEPEVRSAASAAILKIDSPEGGSR